jgi:hypothetical protein
MAIAVQWENQQNRTILWDFDEYWTWDEFVDSMRVSNAMIASMDTQIDVFLNAAGTKIPTAVMAKYQRFALGYLPLNTGEITLHCDNNISAAHAIAAFFGNVQIISKSPVARGMMYMPTMRLS